MCQKSMSRIERGRCHCLSKYDVHSEFDLKKHKEKYIHYLEVMIDEDGKVHYAVPSHQEWAIREACKKLGMTRDELSEATPKEFYCDWLNWLLSQCGAVAVWERFYEGKPNKKQKSTLRKLKLGGVYRGKLPGEDTFITYENEHENSFTMSIENLIPIWYNDDAERGSFSDI